MADLKREFASADALDVPDLWSEVQRRAGAPSVSAPDRRSRPRAGRRVATVLVSLGLFAAAGALVWLALSPSTPDRQPEPAQTGAGERDPWKELDSGLNELPPPPASRSGQVIQWTGGSIVVWGGAVDDGAKLFDDGYAYDPATERWESLAPSPLSPRYFATSVWTGREVLIWGGWDGSRGFFADGAAYDPSTGTWRVLAPSPLDARVPLGAVWTGREMLVWGSGPPMPRGRRDVTGAAYDPTADSWRLLADAPHPINWGSVVWTGDELVVVGASVRESNRPDTPHAVAVAYDPLTDTWRELPPIDLDPNGTFGASAGRQVVVLDRSHATVAYDLEKNRWLKLPRLPLRGAEGWPALAAVDGFVFVRSMRGPAVLNVAERSWETDIGEDSGYPVKVGSVILLWPGDTGGEARSVFVWKPPG